MLYPVELQAQSSPVEHVAGRGRGIRTPDFCVPNATLYQTELYPANHQVIRPLNYTGDGYRPIGGVRDLRHVVSRGRCNRCSARNSGAPGEIRTPDHLVRSQVLYPTELRAHG